MVVGTQNKAIIENLNIKGDAFNGFSMHEIWSSPDKTVVGDSVRIVEPKDAQPVKETQATIAIQVLTK